MRAPLATPAPRPGLALGVGLAAALAVAAAPAHAQDARRDDGGRAATPAAPAPAVRPPAPSPASADPWEGFNRKSFAFSQWVDRVAIRPGAIFYKRATPRFIRAGLHNAIQNLGEPLVAVNDLLQGRIYDFGRSGGRFVANSTVGLGGLIDVAAKGGIPHHDNGFGLTLGRAGVGPGPFVYVPVLGPTTVRDGLGQGVDAALNPFTWINYPNRTAVGVGTGIVGGLDLRASADKDLKTLRNMSTDEYATLRSFYLQNKQAQITGGVVNVDALPAFDDPGAGATPMPASPAAPGSVSPTGAPALPAPATGPSGDAAALPHPAGSEAAPPPRP